MGPHVFACGNRPAASLSHLRPKLQWGRTFLRAEIGASILKLLLFIWASMGPHVFACGNRESSDGFHAGGRASMGPHVFACGNPWHTWMRPSPRSLQWGRTFLRAEMAPLIEGCGAAQQRFNGAARFCVRKSRYTMLGPFRATRASMGPHVFACGNESYLLRLGRRRPASMGPHVFACGNRTICRTAAEHTGSFNGAARFCVRKSLFARRIWKTTPWLQWGRTFLRAEIQIGASGVLYGCGASMGPHVFACGNQQMITAANARLAASMGPHVFACGNSGRPFGR